MKKLFIIAGMIVAGATYAQNSSNGYLGNVGINTTTPGATLDVNVSQSTSLDKTYGQGIAFPRVNLSTLNAMINDIVTSSMVYVEKIDTTSSITKTEDVDAVGYYFFNGTKWAKLEAPYQRIRGKLTILRNSESTSTGDVIGADKGATSYTVTSKDYFIFTNNSANTTINFPSTSDEEKGRTVYIYNGNTVSGGLSFTGLAGGMTGQNQYRGRVFISTGTGWYSVGL